MHDHPCLSRAGLAREYRDAYRHFYTWRRLAWSAATFHRVPGLGAAARAGMLTQQFYFTYATRRGWHPMMGGIWRRRTPGGRRQVVSDHDAAPHCGAIAAPQPSTRGNRPLDIGRPSSGKNPPSEPQLACRG